MAKYAINRLETFRDNYRAATREQREKITADLVKYELDYIISELWITEGKADER